jgi:hypothetical protein
MAVTALGRCEFVAGVAVGVVEYHDGSLQLIGQSVAGQPLQGLARRRCVRSAAPGQGASPGDIAHII